ncbi:hypothetical protein [Hansschlegelia beijingensis]|uniref:Uncharacterized protein n=1 Tax=Hansschlegelia beijingensis TaxID=1133344 RepID=A0A7W6GFW5_9HYPH|nr:hypothetical protein [Hansschlegelia beijingensis]MBB3973730.1 hypothetical protein [Hansschlegelia beijingensis]
MPVRLWAAIVVFIGSYLPLGLILLVQDVDLTSRNFLCCVEQGGFLPSCLAPLKHPVVALGFVAVSAICFALTAGFLSKCRTKAKTSIVIREAVYKPNDMISYVFPYLVTFMTVTFDDIPRILGFTIFMVWLFVITYKAGRIFVNPLLIVFDWRLYEVTYSFAGDEQRFSSLALAKAGNVAEGSWLSMQVEDLLIIRAVE